MKPKRVDMVVKVFKKLDKNLSGEVTIDDLIDVYDVSKNPRFLNGEMSQEKCLKQFLEHFEANLHCDGIVSIIFLVNLLIKIISHYYLIFYYQ